MKKLPTAIAGRFATSPLRAILTFFISLGFGSELPAHSDPWGDIHPQVLVEDGKFSIVFNTSLPGRESDYTDEKPLFRTIHTADGKLFAPRHPLERKRSHEETGPVGLYGRELRLGDTVISFLPDRSGKPSYVLKSPAGKLTRVRLPWPDSVSLSLFEDALVVPDGIAITGKQGERAEDGGSLRFYWFPHDSTASPRILTIGDTVCIYDFPMASNIVFAGDRFWLAYMRPVENEGIKLSLWSWKPGEKTGRLETLDSPAYGNSHLSLAAIGDRLCLAYHCVDGTQRDGNDLARIITVFRNAE